MKLLGKIGTVAIGCAVAGILVWLFAMYTIPEGHVGIVKRWGKAIEQVDPGLHIKIPLADRIEIIDIRQRPNVEELQAGTFNQLAVTAKVSINWTVKKDSAIDLFRRYGGLKQFEERILDRRLRSAAKAGISKYTAEQLIRNRQEAVATVMTNMVRRLEEFPITVNSLQIENIDLPPKYRDAVLEKQRARENAEREKHRLEQQRLKALQKVNTAEANAKAKRIEADAEAYRVVTTATANAERVRVVQAELAQSENYIEYIKARRWNGVLPRTVMTGSDGVTPLVPITVK